LTKKSHNILVRIVIDSKRCLSIWDFLSTNTQLLFELFCDMHDWYSTSGPHPTETTPTVRW